LLHYRTPQPTNLLEASFPICDLCHEALKHNNCELCFCLYCTEKIINAGCIRVYVNWIAFGSFSDTESIFAFISHGRFIIFGTIGIESCFFCVMFWNKNNLCVFFVHSTVMKSAAAAACIHSISNICENGLFWHSLFMTIVLRLLIADIICKCVLFISVRANFAPVISIGILVIWHTC